MPNLLNQGIFLTLLLIVVCSFSLLLYALIECYDGLTRWWIKRKILRNPSVGYREEDILVYGERGCEYRYRMKETMVPKKGMTVEWISRRQRMNPFEKGLSQAPTFWYGLLCGIALDIKIVVGTLLFTGVLCFVYLIPISTKEALFTQVVMKMAGIQHVKVKYKEGGWLAMEGIRYTTTDHREEPFVANIHPLQWLFFGKPASVTRYRGKPYGNVTYEVYHDAIGNLTFLKEGQKVTGHRQGGKIVWEQHQGTGIRRKKIAGHKLPAQKGGARLVDTE